MCSGSIEPVYVLKALIDGMDGVLIGGCHLGDCHYHNGNYKAMRRIEILKTIVRQTGLDENRVWLRWISASEGAKPHTAALEHLAGNVRSMEAPRIRFA